MENKKGATLQMIHFAHKAQKAIHLKYAPRKLSKNGEITLANVKKSCEVAAPCEEKLELVEAVRVFGEGS